MSSNMMTELQRFLCELAEEEGLKTTAFQVVKGGAVTGLGAMAGGLLLGPVGFFIGGSVMGGFATMTCKDFKPLHQVLSEMPEHRWQRLETRVKRIMQDRGVMDVIGFAAMAVTGTTVREQLIMELFEFAQKELGSNVIRQ